MKTWLFCIRNFWAKDPIPPSTGSSTAPSTIDQESDTETISSSPTDDFHRITLENELTKLQLKNIKLESKYKAVKHDLRYYQIRNNDLQSEFKRYLTEKSKTGITG